MNVFTEPHFQSDEEARKFLERFRWPNGPACPHCGECERRYATKREGRYRCASCRMDFTVTTGTVMESSHIGLHKWLMGFYLMCASKKGFSAHQLMRSVGVTYKSAWFMAHRIREAMKVGGLVPSGPIGGEGKIVEADETYFGRKENPVPSKSRRGQPYIKQGKATNKRAVVALVERGGSVRSFHAAVADKETVTRILKDNVARETRLQTDESKLYFGSDERFASHETVRHTAKEYARGDVNTNSVEGYFSIFKRGMRGIYQHCAEKHLHRYLAEYDFRYNHRVKLGYSDTVRTVAAIQGAEGKRLTYKKAGRTSLLA